VCIGPEVSIRHMASGRDCLDGESGTILVRGTPVFAGYCGVDNSNTFLADGWFDTGDLGYFDTDGWLFITGRSKEVINRGGETLAPYEIEQQVAMHPDVLEAMAFAMPHTCVSSPSPTPPTLICSVRNRTKRDSGSMAIRAKP
jgi:non-ribosomal peptide synthetase component E (peptide arylation enzyme)